MTGKLSLRLMCDFLIRYDNDVTTLTSREVVEKCFSMLHDTESIESFQTEDSSMTKRVWEVKREKCPYCKVDIHLSGINPAKCPNGHNYIRCCLTLQACKLRTYRVCLGCERKISEKNLSGLLDVESVLLNIDVCPFCGCRFVEHQTWLIYCSLSCSSCRCYIASIRYL